MNRREIAALLHYAATLDGRLGRVVADEELAAVAITRWAEALADVPGTTADGGWDASHVVRHYYERRGGDQSARYYAIEPHHLLAAWAGHRADLMNRHTDPLPTAHPDDVTAYRAEIVGTRTAVATGQQRPNAASRALDPAGQHRLAALAAATGAMPAQVRDELARNGIGTRREHFPEYAVDCPHPTCRAAARRPCKAPSGRELRSHTHDKRQAAYAESLAAQQNDAAA
ncbi:hypothetical protein [Streptomyces sp. NPDC059080]|uniref:hypothetical protein n=1 Tax=Streptomyces sp. NPDC059080 TaxID=3346718 RepID=UPI0036A63370